METHPQGLYCGLLQRPEQGRGAGGVAATQGPGPVKLRGSEGSGPWVARPKLRRQGGVHSHLAGRRQGGPEATGGLRKRYRRPRLPFKPQVRLAQGGYFQAYRPPFRPPTTTGLSQGVAISPVP